MWLIRFYVKDDFFMEEEMKYLEEKHKKQKLERIKIKENLFAMSNVTKSNKIEYMGKLKCINCERIWTSNKRNDERTPGKCPKCGSKKIFWLNLYEIKKSIINSPPF